MLAKENKKCVRNGPHFPITNEEGIFLYQRDISIFKFYKISVSF